MKMTNNIFPHAPDNSWKSPLKYSCLYKLISINRTMANPLVIVFDYLMVIK